MVDVAKAAGVSQTTASFVLNKRDGSIPVETRERVWQAAQQLGYRLHAGARALATGRTHRIGLVLNESESFRAGDAYHTEITAGIVDGAVSHEHDLLLHCANYPNMEALQQDILSGSTDGVLLAGRYTGDALTTMLLDAGFPTVCISYHIEHPLCYSVDGANEEGAQMAVRHLLDLGHQHIAFFYPEVASWGRERHIGALQAMAEAGLPPENLHTLTWSETTGSQSEVTRQWILSALDFLKNVHPRPTGLVCCEEARVRALMEMLPDTGIRVPDDLAVVSFNSTEMSARARPPMTSVWQPLKEIGEAAVGMLVSRIEGRELKDGIRRFPMRLEIRESCGARNSITS
jgi:DNA-binding LacI/PurR family transcriptional regulator